MPCKWGPTWCSMLLMNRSKEKGRRGGKELLPMEDVVVLADVSGDIQPEGQDKIDDDRGAQRKKTEINKM